MHREANIVGAAGGEGSLRALVLVSAVEANSVGRSSGAEEACGQRECELHGEGVLNRGEYNSRSSGDCLRTDTR